MKFGPRNPYNVIILVIDCLRAPSLGCHGYGKPTSSNIDSLAKQGVLFENAYCCSNHTDPSLTSIFSGKYPLSHGIVHHGTDVTEHELQDLQGTGTIFLQEILKAADYETMAISYLMRWHKRGYDFYGESVQGYDSGAEGKGVRKRVLHRIGRGTRRVSPGLHRKLVGFATRSGILETRDAARFVDLAIQLLEQRRRENFLLFIHFADVHYPYTVPRRAIERFVNPNGEDVPLSRILGRIDNPAWRRLARDVNLAGMRGSRDIEAAYDAGLYRADQEIGRLLDYLEGKALADDTLIVVTGDHGDNYIEDGLFRGHFGLYEPVTHVPLIISGGVLPRQQRVRGFVQHADLVPTLLDLLGIPPGTFGFDGVSLSPAIETGTIDRSTVLIMDAAVDWRFALRTPEHKYIWSMTGQDPRGPYGVGRRDTEELYDLRDDPNEKVNIVKTVPDTTRRLREEMIHQVMMLVQRKQLRKKLHMRIGALAKSGG